MLLVFPFFYKLTRLLHQVNGNSSAATEELIYSSFTFITSSFIESTFTFVSG